MLNLTCIWYRYTFAAFGVFGGEDTRRLSREASGEILQPAEDRSIQRAQEAHHAACGTRRAKCDVLHDPGGWFVNGVQHVWPRGRASDQGHIVFLDALQW